MEFTSHPIDRVTQILLIVLFAVLPLFFLPITQDFYDLNKWMLLTSIGLMIVLLWGIRAALTDRLTLSLHPATWAFAGLVAATGLSTAIASPNKIEALLHPLGPVTFGTLFLISVLGGFTLHHTTKTLIYTGLRIVGAVVSVIAGLQFFGLTKGLTTQFPFLADTLWTTTGNPTTTIAILFILFIIVADDLRKAIENQQMVKIVHHALFGALYIAGISFLIIKVSAVFTQSFLPFQQAWAIMLEVFKNPKQAMFGIGPENFLSAFTLGKLPTINTSPIWNVRFVTSSSTFLHIATTGGIAGLIASLLFLQFLFPKKAGAQILQGKIPSGLHVGLFVSMISFLVVPPSLTLFVFFAALLLLSPDSSTIVDMEFPKAIGGIGKEVAVIAGVAFAAGVYGIGRPYIAELKFYQSILAARKNDGTKTYNTQVEVLKFNPLASRFHLAYSQTNWALANAIANNAPVATAAGQPRQLSDTDRQTISSLIEQAIREAKLAVNLAPNNIIMWENLSNLYQNLTGIAQGADQWATAAYQKAIQLEPTNPVLRLRYGALLLTRIGDRDGATQQFLVASNLKPDFANAHYHLAVAYNDRKEYLKTALELRQALSLVPTTNPDYERVFGELTEVKKKLTPQELTFFEGQKNQATPDNGLTNPKEEKTPQIQPKIELPAEASPPAVPEAPKETQAPPIP